MPTRLRLNGTRTVPEAGALGQYASGPQADITRATPTSTVSFPRNANFDAAEPAGEWKFARAGSPSAAVEWWSERVAAEFTISGQVSFAVYITPITGGWSGKVRFRLYKITAGGSAIRTLIVEGTSAAFSTSGQKLFTATPAAPVTLVRGERIIAIVTAVEHNSTGTLTQAVNSGGDTINSYFELTETATFLDNIVQLQLRRTAVNAIGTFFDALPLPRGGSAATTGVTNTTAGGIKIPLTRTAGGTALHWITGRVKEPFSLFTLDQFTGRVYAHESNAAANCTFRLELLHYAPDGTETLCMAVDFTVEVATTSTTTPWGVSVANSTETLVQAMHFEEDDRVVLRGFLIPAPTLTMGGGHTATLTYDHSAANVSGDSYFALNGALTFKAEGDPARSEVIPDAMNTLGVSNG